MFNESLKLNPMHIPTLQYRGACKCILNDINGGLADLYQVLELFESSREATKQFLETYNR